MTFIDYEQHRRRALELRARAITQFGRGLRAAIARGLVCAARTLAEHLDAADRRSAAHPPRSPA